MKRKSCMFLAVLLVMVQLIGVFAVLPASAESVKNYNIYKTTGNITLDGISQEWDNVPWSEAFTYGYSNNEGIAPANSNIRAAYKAMWKESETAGKMNVYIMVKIENVLSNSTSAPCWIMLDSGDSSYNTGNIHVPYDNTVKTTDSLSSKGFKGVSYGNAKSGVTTLEVEFPNVSIPQDGKIALNVTVCEYANATYPYHFRAYSWTGEAHNANSCGVGVISNNTVDVSTRSYDIYQTTSDVSVDGEDVEWKNVPWSEGDFAAGYNQAPASTSPNDDMDVSFKALWKENKDETRDLYFLVRLQNGLGTQVTSNTTCKVHMEIGGVSRMINYVAFHNGARNTIDNTDHYAKGLGWLTNVEGVVEGVCRGVSIAPGDSIKLNVYVLEYTNTTANPKFRAYTWTGTKNDDLSAGVANIKNEIIDAPARNYDIKQTVADITVNADPVEWDHVDWSQGNFAHGYNNSPAGSTVEDTNIKVGFKAVWKESATAGEMDLYFLVKMENALPNSSTHRYTNSRIVTKVGETQYLTGWLPIHENTSKNETGWSGQSIKLGDGEAIAEYVIYNVPQGEKIKLNVSILEYNSTGTQFRAYTWTGGSSNDVSGSATINDEINPLVGVRVAATDGASIRLDTANEAKSGIRFGTTVTVPANATLIKTGTLIVPTAHLTNNGIADSAFTLEALTAANLKENTNFYNIVNENNEWVEGMNGTWYGTLINIQSANYGRSISGIGYAVIEVEGVEYTVYADYDSAKHSRSIAEIAQTLLDNKYYAEGSVEESLLKTFVATGAN